MHPEIDRYAHLESAIHRWDPRWKLASLAVLLGAFAIGPSPAQRATWNRDVPHALACLAASLALVQLSRIPLSFALRRILPAGLFLGTFLILYPFGLDGEGPRLGPFAYSPERALTAGCIVIRAAAIILLLFPLFGTSRFDVTMKAIRALRVPAPLAQLLAFSYRYIYVYVDELRRMRIALRARGFRVRPSRHAIRTAGNGLGMLLVRSVERTERIQLAMVARGYSGTFRAFDDFSTRAGDVAKSAAALAAAALLLGSRFLR
jgi:cobalt/nickel transport system permease protein